MFAKNKPILSQAAEVVDDLAAKVQPAIEAAIEQVGPLLEDAKVKARDAAGSVSSAAESAATSATASVKTLASDVTGKPEPAKRGALKKLLLLAGLAGIGAVIFKKLRAKDAGWQTTYDAPSPVPAPAAKTPAAPAPVEESAVEDVPVATEEEAASDEPIVSDATDVVDEAPAPEETTEAVEAASEVDPLSDESFGSQAGLHEASAAEGDAVEGDSEPKPQV